MKSLHPAILSISSTPTLFTGRGTALIGPSILTLSNALFYSDSRPSSFFTIASRSTLVYYLPRYFFNGLSNLGAPALWAKCTGSIPGRSAFSCLTADDSELKRILDTSPFYYETLLSASLALRFKLRPAVPYLALALYSCVLTRMAISSCSASSSALTFFFFFVGRTFTK